MEKGSQNEVQIQGMCERTLFQKKIEMFGTLKIHRHGWSKISVFQFFCIFTTPWSYINIGFKIIQLLKCLIPVKTTCNLHCWIQLSPVFQNGPQHTNIWPDLWVTSFFEFKGNVEVTQKKILLPNVFVPILAKRQN